MSGYKKIKPRWKKGESGNPAGSTKTRREFKQLMVDLLSDDKNGIDSITEIILKMKQRAIDGDQRAAEYLLDHVIGKVDQHIDVTVDKPDIVGFIIENAEETNADNAQIKIQQ